MDKLNEQIIHILLQCLSWNRFLAIKSAPILVKKNNFLASLYIFEISPCFESAQGIRHSYKEGSNKTSLVHVQLLQSLFLPKRDRCPYSKKWPHLRIVFSLWQQDFYNVLPCLESWSKSPACAKSYRSPWLVFLGFIYFFLLNDLHQFVFLFFPHFFFTVHLNHPSLLQNLVCRS